MSRGAEKNYKFGPKNNWRRRTWNEIKRRVKCPHDSVALYMPGASDIDRHVAISRGFRDINLIGVDNDKGIVADLRKNRVLAIHGDILDVLSCWDFDRKLDVINFDFCNGITSENIRAVFLGMCFVRELGAISVNLLRGRERNSLYRYRADGLKDGLKDSINQNIGRKNCSSLLRFKFNEKHRGMHILSLLLEYCFLKVTGSPITYETFLEYKNFVGPLIEKMDIKLDSYKSDSGQYFDSVIISNPFIFYNIENESGFKNRNIAATWAIRTMRINGMLPR